MLLIVASLIWDLSTLTFFKVYMAAYSYRSYQCADQQAFLYVDSGLSTDEMDVAKAVVYQLDHLKQLGSDLDAFDESHSRGHAVGQNDQVRVACSVEAVLDQQFTDMVRLAHKIAFADVFTTNAFSNALGYVALLLERTSQTRAQNRSSPCSNFMSTSSHSTHKASFSKMMGYLTAMAWISFSADLQST